MDFSQYLNSNAENNQADIKNESFEASIEQTNVVQEENGAVLLTRERIAEFSKRLSGKDVNGLSKATVSYQTYAIEDPEDSTGKTQIHNLHHASLEISYDPYNPEYYIVDVIFQSPDEQELKMLWGRLQQFKRKLTANPDKTWVFYFNALESGSVDATNTIDNDTLLTCNIFNPLVFYLTREVPNMLAEEHESKNAFVEEITDLMGGNIVRMVVPVELVTYEVNSTIDTSTVKGEVLREAEEERYINESENGTAWNDNKL